MNKSAIETELERYGSIIMTTAGVSMKPILRNRRDSVVIERISDALKKQDLVLFKRPFKNAQNSNYLLHRIIRIRGNVCFIRGDNQLGLEKVPSDWILGRVTKIYRNNKCIDVNSAGYKLYIWIWYVIYPIRYLIIKLKR